MLFVPLVFLSEGVKSLTKIIHCADLGIFGKYLILPFVYDILFLGKNIVASTIGRKNENPQCCRTGGFLVHFWSRRINSEAGYRLLLLFIQPFADVVGNYACQNGEDKRYCTYRTRGSPTFCTCIVGW